MIAWLATLAMMGVRLHGDRGYNCFGITSEQPNLSLMVCDCISLRMRVPATIGSAYDECGGAPHGLWALNGLYRITEVYRPGVGRWAEYDGFHLYGRW